MTFDQKASCSFKAIELAEEEHAYLPIQESESLYFKKGKAKVQIAVAKGKKQYDKREVKKRKDWERERSRYIRRSS